MTSYNLPSTSQLSNVRPSMTSSNLPSTSQFASVRRTASPETMRQLSMIGMPSNTPTQRPQLTRTTRLRLVNPEDVRTYMDEPEMRESLTFVDTQPNLFSINQIKNMSKVKSVKKPSMVKRME